MILSDQTTSFNPVYACHGSIPLGCTVSQQFLTSSSVDGVSATKGQYYKMDDRDIRTYLGQENPESDDTNAWCLLVFGQECALVNAIGSMPARLKRACV
jgi:hypothetical protein